MLACFKYEISTERKPWEFNRNYDEFNELLHGSSGIYIYIYCFGLKLISFVFPLYLERSIR